MSAGGFLQWVGDLDCAGRAGNAGVTWLPGETKWADARHTDALMLGTCLLHQRRNRASGDLARIALTDEEITRLQGDLNVIAESINKVQEVATDDVEPTANPIPLEAYLRPDVPETPLTQEEATAGAPVSEAGMFVAPRILGEE